MVSDKIIGRLEEIGLALEEPFKNVKAHHMLRCLICSHKWVATPISKFQAYKKYQKKGCVECRKQEKEEVYEEARRRHISAIEARGFEILSNYDGRRTEHITIKVRNKKCGHVFTTSATNIIARDISCPTCNKRIKINRLNLNSWERSAEWQKTATEWQTYKSKVNTVTRRNYYNNQRLINPYSLAFGIAGHDGAHHLDHKVPVRVCFDNNVPPEICGDVTNLQVIPWLENVSQRDHIKENIEIPELIKPYIKG